MGKLCRIEEYKCVDMQMCRNMDAPKRDGSRSRRVEADMDPKDGAQQVK